jgi:1,4-alpha-glucan branching enzyme
VRAFLLSSALYWLEEFHFDGLRVDAVASMLYLDFAQAGRMVPNKSAGAKTSTPSTSCARSTPWCTRDPGAIVTIAEESTAWPMVSRPTYVGGLGFSMKWNMGWMNDSLRYFASATRSTAAWHHDLN